MTLENVSEWWSSSKEKTHSPVLIGVTQVFVLHADWAVVSIRMDLLETRAYRSSIENGAMPPDSQRYPTSLLPVVPLAVYK